METTIKTLSKLLGLLFVLFIVNSIIGIKLQSPKNQGIKDVISRHRSYVSANNVDRNLECLAMNIYKEAGNESFEGKVAVAQVTLNRVDHPAFPKEVCNVVHEKNVIMEKVVCQFSWYCDNAYKAQPVNKVSYQESYAVAKKVLLEGFRLDGLHDALYYHATYINPNWNLKPIAVIGQHKFYKEKT